MAPIIPFIPLIAAGLGVGTAVYSSSEAKKRAESQQEDQAELQTQQGQLWKENAFPTAAEIATQRATGMSQLGTERSRRYESLARNLSTRGIGPGSPYGAGGASSIEGSYLGGLGNLENTLINAQNKPRFNYPFLGAPSVTNVPGGSNSNPLGMALGMMAGSKGLEKMFGGGTGTPPAIIPGYGDVTSGMDLSALYSML